LWRARTQYPKPVFVLDVSLFCTVINNIENYFKKITKCINWSQMKHRKAEHTNMPQKQNVLHNKNIIYDNLIKWKPFQNVKYLGSRTINTNEHSSVNATYSTCHLSDHKLAVCFIQMLSYLSLVSSNQSMPGGGNFVSAVLQINLAVNLRNCYIKKMLTNMWINTLTSLYSISQSLVISDVIPFSMLEGYQ
jgi:hypothetical protein